MTPEHMKQALAIESLPACFSDLYQQMEHSWEKHAATILSDSFLSETLSSCYALAPYHEKILQAAKAIRENPAMCLLICLLEAWVRNCGNVMDPAYTPPTKEGVEYDFLHLFPAIPTMPESVSHLHSRHVPEDIIAATLREYDASVEMCVATLGRPAFDRSRLNWLCRVIRNQIIHIDRFNYDLPGKFLWAFRVFRNQSGELRILAHDVQVHSSGRLLGSVGHTDSKGSFWAEIQETATAFIGYPCVNGLVEKEQIVLPKNQWSQCLCEEDLVLRIHIPRSGSFDRQAIENAYRRAREVFATCYPDRPYKAFYCTSWLMSEDLRAILKPESNILAFQDTFVRVPCRSSGALVFPFAFYLPAAIPENLQALPENTSLQRGIKQWYLDGGYVHEGAGFFF